MPTLLPLSNNYPFERQVTIITFIMSFLILELALFSIMANATTHPTENVLKTIGGHYGEGKRKEDWVGGLGGQKKKSRGT